MAIGRFDFGRRDSDSLRRHADSRTRLSEIGLEFLLLSRAMR